MPDRQRAGAYSHKDFIEIKVMVNAGFSFPDPERDSFFLAPDCSDAELGETLLKALSLYRVLPLEFKGRRTLFDRVIETLQKVFSLNRVLPPELEERRALLDSIIDGSAHDKRVARNMARFGYKRKGQYFKRLHNCFVERFENTITISPTNHRAPDAWGGLDPSEDVHIPADSTPEEIGAALRLGFSRCWGRY